MKKTKFILLTALFGSVFLSLTGCMNQKHLWAGANQYQIAQMSNSDISTQLDAMQRSNLKILRIFIGPRRDLAWERQNKGWYYENPIGVFHDDQINKIDKLMKECSDRNIKMIIALINFANPVTSNPVYLKQFGPVGIYENEAIKAYKNRFNYLLNHKNPYMENRAWKELNNVVFAWEIGNEPGVSLHKLKKMSNEKKYKLMRNFLTEMASELKKLDPDTPVSLGIAGYDKYYTKGSADDIETLGNIKDADIYTLHFYGGDLQKWLDDTMPLMKTWNKKLFVEEFGTTRKEGKEKTYDIYNSVTEICNKNKIPWMFWRLGLRKDKGTWSIMDDDPVWNKVIVPRAEEISQTTTPQTW